MALSIFGRTGRGALSHFPWTILLLILGTQLFNSVSIVAAQSNQSKLDPRLERLRVLADVWGLMLLYHPTVGTRDAHWGSVLNAAIPAVEKASTPAELVYALNATVLDSLNDPLTFAYLGKPQRSRSGPNSPLGITSGGLGDDTWYVDLRDRRSYEQPDFPKLLSAAITGGTTRRYLVVDARWNNGEPYPRGEWLRLWLDTAVVMGSRVSRQYFGWTEQPTNAASDQMYQQRWTTEERVPLLPFRERPRTDPRWALPNSTVPDLPTVRQPTLFLVNRASYPWLERELDVLQQVAPVAFVLDPTGTVSETAVLEYPGDVRVRVNTAMLVSLRGSLGGSPDSLARDSLRHEDFPRLAEALLERSRSPARRTFDYHLGYPGPMPVDSLPSREDRLHGIFKVWSVIRALHPNPERFSASWWDKLPEWIVASDSAVGLWAYRRVLQRMNGTLRDSHGTTRYPLPTPASAEATIPARIERLRDGKFYVVQVAADERELALGDQVIAVDGQSIDSIRTQLLPFLGASHLGRRDWLTSIYGFLGMTGPKDSPARIAVRQPDGTIRTITRPRTIPPGAWFTFQQRVERPARRLPGNLGYMSLFSIRGGEALDSIMRSFMETDGLVIDTRFGTSVDLDRVAGWLWETPEPGLRLRGIIPVTSWVAQRPSRSNVDAVFDQDPAAWRRQPLVYAKPVVLLIDYSNLSGMEVLPMRVRETHRGLLVGRATAGSTGNATQIYVPGGISVEFSGMDQRYSDASPFNGVGAIPHVEVPTTVAGVKAGRDEIFDAGVRELGKLVRRKGGG